MQGTGWKVGSLGSVSYLAGPWYTELFAHHDLLPYPTGT